MRHLCIFLINFNLNVNFYPNWSKSDQCKFEISFGGDGTLESVANSYSLENRRQRQMTFSNDLTNICGTKNNFFSDSKGRRGISCCKYPNYFWVKFPDIEPKECREFKRTIALLLKVYSCLPLFKSCQ